MGTHCCVLGSKADKYSFIYCTIFVPAKIFQLFIHCLIDRERQTLLLLLRKHNEIGCNPRCKRIDTTAFVVSYIVTVRRSEAMFSKIWWKNFAITPLIVKKGYGHFVNKCYASFTVQFGGLAALNKCTCTSTRPHTETFEATTQWESEACEGVLQG